MELNMKQSMINRKLVLYEPEGGIYFGTDALLLAHFMKSFKKGTGAELGTGSGIIPLLLLSGGCRANITGIEIQPEYCRAAEMNAEKNGLLESFKIIQGDIREIKKYFEAGSCDVVFTNPPYLKTTCGKKNASDQKNIAFHEVFCSIDDICGAASWCLKSGGKFFAVYRPERLAGLLFSLRSRRIEPKRMRFVVPSCGKPPSLVLIEGKKDAREGLKIEPDLCVYADKSHTVYSEEMEKIYKEFE